MKVTVILVVEGREGVQTEKKATAEIPDGIDLEVPVVDSNGEQKVNAFFQRSHSTKTVREVSKALFETL